MKISGRLALAMVLLVVATSCMVGAFACYLVGDAAPRAVLMSIASAALAGGGIAAGLALALAAGMTNVLLEPAAAKPADAGAETEQARAYQALADRERMAQAIIEEALDAFVQTDGSCIVLDWSPHAEALMGWTRAEALGRNVEQLVFPVVQRPVHRQWVDRFLSEASGDAA